MGNEVMCTAADDTEGELEALQVDLAAADRLRGLTPHERITLKKLVPACAQWPGFDPPDEHCLVPSWEPDTYNLEDVENFRNFILPTDDEDLPKDPFFKRLSEIALNNVFGVDDRDDVFEDADQGAEWLQKCYGLVWGRGLEFEHKWRFNTDETHEDFAFFGFACHLVRRIRPSDSSAPQNAAFIVDVTGLSCLAVREGYVPFGAAAYFDEKKKIIGIYVSYKDQYFPKTCDPQDWEHAKFVWRSTVFIDVTVEHLVQCHLIIANCFVCACRRLPSDHPLRRLFKPYTFRTVHVNYKIVYRLVGMNGLAIRAFALTHANRVMRHRNRLFRFRSFAKIPEENGMENEPFEEYGFNDIVEYTNIVKKFLTNYIDIYYQHDINNVKNDPFCVQFIHELASGLGIDTLTDLTYEKFTDLLTTLVVAVTAYHEQVGTIQQYMDRPDSCTGKIREGAVMADQQAFVQLSFLGLATGTVMPKLMNDWTYLLLRDENLERTTQVLQTFQRDLEEYNVIVEERNSRRRAPTLCCYPKVLESAVSV